MIKALEAIQDLIEGKRLPQTEAERYFLKGFHAALREIRFFDKYLEIVSEIDYYGDMDLYHAFCLGYGMGQIKLDEEIAEYDSGNKPSH